MLEARDGLIQRKPGGQRPPQGHGPGGASAPYTRTLTTRHARDSFCRNTSRCWLRLVRRQCAGEAGVVRVVAVRPPAEGHRACAVDVEVAERALEAPTRHAVLRRRRQHRVGRVQLALPNQRHIRARDLPHLHRADRSAQQLEQECADGQRERQVPQAANDDRGLGVVRHDVELDSRGDSPPTCAGCAAE